LLPRSGVKRQKGRDGKSPARGSKEMDPTLEQILNLLLESERAGTLALEDLAAKVEELRRFIAAARDNEAANASQLSRLITKAGGTPSKLIGPFAAKMAALDSIPERLELLSRGESWVARKIESALDLAPDSGPIRDFLTAMANHHRHEVEWNNAEVIRLIREPGKDPEPKTR
jgi:nitronate monooxygenase